MMAHSRGLQRELPSNHGTPKGQAQPISLVGARNSQVQGFAGRTLWRSSNRAHSMKVIQQSAQQPGAACALFFVPVDSAVAHHFTR